MSRHEDEVRLRHMLDHAREAAHMASGRTRADLDADRQLGLALVRLLEIVGEAASRVTKTTCRSHPQVPWPQIVSLRNRLIHGYDAVDYDVLWKVIEEDLPPLINKLTAILKPSSSQPGSGPVTQGP